MLVSHGALAGQVAFTDTMSDPNSIEGIAGDNLWSFLRSLLMRG